MHESSSKIKLLILFGGRSAEHEVSLQSARNVVDALDRSKYALVLVGIDKAGFWYHCNPDGFLLNAGDPNRIALRHTSEQVMLICGEGSRRLARVGDGVVLGRIDAALPILHGPFGEDGTVQGLLKLADIPCVGSGVLGSAVGMDKDVMKRLLRDAGLPVSKFMVVHRHDFTASAFDVAADCLGLPLFVKPANMGSSVGIHRVGSRAEFEAAAEDAFRYDSKLVLEEQVSGREVECAVLGNEVPVASPVGEVVADHARHPFYDYDAKYCDEAGAALYVPADLPPETLGRVQELAVQTFTALCCEGMGRVDMFVREDGEVFVNEINTIPGFTKISMYPKLWQAAGLSYAQLLDRLVALAIEQHAAAAGLHHSRAATSS